MQWEYGIMDEAKWYAYILYIKRQYVQIKVIKLVFINYYLNQIRISVLTTPSPELDYYKNVGNNIRIMLFQ